MSSQKKQEVIKRRKTISFQIKGRPKILVRMARVASRIYDLCIALNREYYKNSDPKKNLSKSKLWELFRQRHGKEYKALTNGLPKAGFQETVFEVAEAFKNYKLALKEYFVDPSKYNARPKPPKLKGRMVRTFTFTTRQVRIDTETGVVRFPEFVQNDKEFKLNTFILDKDFVSRSVGEFVFEADNWSENLLAKVKYIPEQGHFVLKLSFLYTTTVQRLDNNWAIAIDPNMTNFAIVFNTGDRPVIIDIFDFIGFRSDMTDQIVTAGSEERWELLRLQSAKTEQYWNVVAKKIFDYLLENNISRIVAGYNKNWKHELKLGRDTNRTMGCISYRRLYDRLRDLAKDYGVVFVEEEEAFTSGVCYLCDEYPDRTNYDISRRVCTRLWRCHKHQVHADVNSAANIGVRNSPHLFQGKRANSPNARRRVRLHAPIIINGLGEPFL